MRQMRYRFFLLPLIFVLACAGAFAQANSELTGVVTDQTGAAVPGATIVLTNPATGITKTTVSGDTGLYNFAGLNPANYNMKVNAKGFQSYAQTGIVVNVSSTARADVKLTVGAETQTVTVEADALAVQSDSNVVSTLISSEQISQIATQNRNFAALAALGLGVSSALPDSNTPTSVASNFTISVNGLRQSHNIWLIDGGEADDRGGSGGMDIMPSQDAIAEFTMLTSNYPPDYGISSGATMSLSLKSGTQKFHGEAWEFNRNTAYDANNYFNKYNTTTPSPRQVLNYNIYGFNIGGPLFIPKVYNQNKQKTFFFWNEEWRKINQGNTPNQVNTIPTSDIPTAGTDLTYTSPLFASSSTDSGTGITTNPGIVVPLSGAAATQAGVQNAYFEPCLGSQYTTSGQRDTCQAALLTQYGLTPGQPFPNNKIPAALFDPNAVLYLNSGILPKPSTADGKAVSSAQTPINVRDDVVRVDHKINDKWQLLGHYMHDSVTQNYGQPFLGWLWASYNTVTSTLSNPSNSAALKLSGTINPNLLVEASINYDGNIINITNSKNALAPTGWGINSFFDLTKIPQGKSVGQPSLPNMNGFGNPYGTALDLGSAPWHNAAEDYEPKVDVSYTVGKHAMKFGFSYNRYTKNQQLFGDSQGQFGWGGTSQGQFTGNLALCNSKLSDTNTQTTCTQGDGMMDMLLGMAAGYDQFQAEPINHYVNQTPSVYAMDNWHVTPRMTLQLGLRYDALPHAWERNNLMANFDPGYYLSTASPVWQSNGSMDSTGPGFASYTVAGITSPYYTNGMRIAGQGGFPRGLVKNDYGTLQPRVGFSEDLFGNGKTVLRGGIGTFYERMQGNDVYNAATNVPFANDPGATFVNMSDPHTSTITGQQAATPFFASGLTTLALSYPAPAVAQFSLGVQRELSPSVIWVVQYVGNLAWHQNINRPANNFPLTTDMGVRKLGGSVGDSGYVSASGATVILPDSGQGNVANNSNSFRTYQGYGGITSQENDTNGNYNGFQTGVRIQNRWGLSGEIDYTWSHELDVTSYDLNTISNPWNFKYDKGSGALDRRNMLNANYIYKLPFFTQSKGLVNSIAGGWEIAGTFIDESGVPVSPGYSGNDTIGLGGGYTNRMNVSGKMKYPKKVSEWFDTTMVSAPQAAWDGGPNLGFGSGHKDSIVGPGRVNFTTSLYKSFSMTERAHFELRFESFNTFNHTQFNGISANGPKANNGSIGQVTNTWDPRTLELGGKFVF
jgi:Carboxypeptidase regulatory-like domain